MAANSRINWENLSTVVSVMILVGAEVFGVAVAAGWATAGLLELSREVGYVLMVLFSLIGFYAMWMFWQRAVQVEPIRHRP